jgi:hypothetical protein
LSACWENLDGAGVFASDRAAAATDAVLGWLRSPVPGSTHRLEAEDRLLLFGLDINLEDQNWLTGWLTGGKDRVAIASGITGAVVVAGPPAQRLESELPRLPIASAVEALRFATGGPAAVDELDESLVAELVALGAKYGQLGVLGAAAQVWEAARDAATEPEHNHPEDIDCTYPHCPKATS